MCSSDLAGTLSGNPLAVAAGTATLEHLRDDPPYERLERHGARLEAGFRAAAAAAGRTVTINRVGSMMTAFFQQGAPFAVTGWKTASRSDTAAYGRFFWELIARGIYFPCSQYEALFISDAHDDADIDATIAAAREAFAAA